MSLAGQEGNNCSSVSTQIFMQPSHLPFDWLLIIEYPIYPHHHIPMRQVLAMRKQSSLVSGRTSLVPAILKAFCSEKLFPLIFTLLDRKSVHQKANICLLREIRLKFGDCCTYNTCVAYVSSTKSFAQ